MSITFTKLFSSITESTIWCEDAPTRIVWITMLAMSDRQGRIWASIPGLANRARVTIEQCENALQKFQEPDTYSRTPDNEGRRITAIDGGWFLLNHKKYRELRDEEDRREYKREWIKDKRRQCRQNVDNVDRGRPQYTNADADADADADAEKSKRKTPRTTKSREVKDQTGADAPIVFHPERVIGLNLEAWKLWLEHRKAIKKPIRPHSMQYAADVLVKLGAAQLAEVKRAMANGWQGLYPEKTLVKLDGHAPKRYRTADELEAEELARETANAQH